MLIGLHLIALRQPKRPCFGVRPWDGKTQSFGPYQWMDYQTARRRRAAIGAGLVEVHERVGVKGRNYGVGLWCQNRPEWQLVGWFICFHHARVCMEY